VCAAALGLGLPGVVLALRSAQLLTGRGRPRRGPQPRFVLAGPYLRVRNPLYAGIVLAIGGAAVGARSSALAVATLALAVVLHVWVVLVEEPRLRARFGAAYAEYLLRVPRWFPALRRVTGSGKGRRR
jgi:protein-S-isoprenylcysteine O-methyltransferase Ste14